jgi:hypothetical protein
MNLEILSFSSQEQRQSKGRPISKKWISFVDKKKDKRLSFSRV